jgi:hypothetical protein
MFSYLKSRVELFKQGVSEEKRARFLKRKEELKEMARAAKEKVEAEVAEHSTGLTVGTIGGLTVGLVAGATGVAAGLNLLVLGTGCVVAGAGVGYGVSKLKSR